MRKILIYTMTLVLMLCIKTQLNAQNLEWAKNFGNISSERVLANAVDATGNVYVVGYFSGAVDFDPSPSFQVLTSAGSTDGFIAKYDVAGNLVWVNKAGGTGTDRLTVIGVAPNGDILAGGYFSGTMTLSGSTFIAGGTRDAFIVDYSSNGNIGDTNVITGPNREEITGIAVKNNMFALTGSFAGTADFSNLGANLTTVTSNGGTDIFVVGVPHTGTPWLQSYGGPLDESPRNIVLDNNNNSYAVGAFQSTVDFDPTVGVDSRSSNGSFDAYIIKNSSTGTVDWVNVFGGTGFERANDVIMDFANNPKVVGIFDSTTNLNPNPTTPVMVTPQGGTDIFISAFLSNRLLIWGKTIGGTLNEEAFGMSRDGAGNLYLAGSFEGTCDFDPGASTENATSVGGRDIFVCKLNGNGDYTWAHGLGSIDFDGAFDMATTSAGMTYIAGSFSNTVDFDPGTTVTNLVSNGAEDAFVAKFGTSPVINTPPASLDLTKRIANVRPSTTANNLIVTFEIELVNDNTISYDNLRMTDVFSNNAMSAIVGVTSQPVATHPFNPTFYLNRNWNGTTNTQLLDISRNSNIQVGQLIRLSYDVEINRAALNDLLTYTNTATISSTTSTIGGTVTLDMKLPHSVTLPTNPVMEIFEGAVPVEFAIWLQNYGGSAGIAHSTCGKITWGYTQDPRPFLQGCGNTGTRYALFTGVDECGNFYRYEGAFKSIDTKAPIVLKEATDKFVNCADGTAELEAWLKTAGGAVFTDSGAENKATVTHNYTNNCTAGVHKVQFNITDACGNVAKTTATLTVDSTKTTKANTNAASIISAKQSMANKTLTCNANLVFDEPQITTTCTQGALSSTYVDEKESGFCNNEFSVKRTWTFKDDCGTVFNTSQTLTVIDNEAPTFGKLPTAFTMKKSLFSVWKKLYFKNIKAVDACSVVALSTPTFKSISAKQVECNLMATDECGNTAIYTCVVSFEDFSTVINKSQQTNNNESSANPALENYEEEIKSAEVIYPNPTAQTVNIALEKHNGKIQKIRLYRLNGQVALNIDAEGQQNDVFSIDISNFEPATYIIELVYNTKTTYHKVQKIN